MTIQLVCRDGFFLTYALDPEEAAKRQSGPARSAACETKFLELIAKVTEQGGYVTDTEAARDLYPPRVDSMPAGKSYSVPEYKRAMGRLFDAGRIRLEPLFPGGKRKTPPRWRGVVLSLNSARSALGSPLSWTCPHPFRPSLHRQRSRPSLCAAAPWSLTALSAFLDVSSLNLAVPSGTALFLPRSVWLRPRPLAALMFS
jgi:hypothetical protein